MMFLTITLPLLEETVAWAAWESGHEALDALDALLLCTCMAARDALKLIFPTSRVPKRDGRAVRAVQYWEVI